MQEFLDQYFILSTISHAELLVRIALAMVMGLILGLDRDLKDKPIDFRAYMIIAVSTCFIAIVGEEILANHMAQGMQYPIDMGKIISGTLAGIGFLGAGAIIHKGDNKVIGTATGASIWASGGLGLAIGFGYYAISVFAFVALFLILTVGGFLMEKLYGKEDNGEH